MFDFCIHASSREHNLQYILFVDEYDFHYRDSLLFQHL